MAKAKNSERVGARPADGERRAIRNLSAQYRVAATLIYDALLAHDLEWVRLVDPEAGRLDDVVIARPGRIDAYQIKWSEYRNEIRFRDLVEESTVSGKPYPAPFRLMADGWGALRAAHPGRRVHAHYLMHDAPTTRDGVTGPGRERRLHLQAFLRHAFPDRAHWTDPSSRSRKDWGPLIEKVFEAVHLKGEELEEFLGDCELDLDFRLPGQDGPQRLRRNADVELLAAALMRRVSGSTGAVELRPDALLADLAWDHRFERRFRHDFPVDEKLYRPIETTIAALNEALAKFEGGYLALTGPPGAGKSTTLTQTLRYRDGFRLIRYYAFVRDDPRTGRGEAVAFLHDLCVAIEDIGIGAASRFEALPTSVEELRERLVELLGELGKAGGKTVILVDGLDHIEREQNPSRSLIDELPPPSAIPDGVFIVLGTQPVGLESRSPAMRPVRRQLGEDGRTIRMAPLSRASVHSIVHAFLPDDQFEPGDDDRIFAASEGHPLALAYLIKRLSRPATEAWTALRHGASATGADIEAEYDAYWAGLAEDPELRELLSLVCRVRGPVSLKTMAALGERLVLERLVRTAGYLFNQLTSDIWAFFHDSFRQFLLRRTGVDAFGRVDASAAADLHRRLAAVAGRSDQDTAMRWQAAYHLAAAGDTVGLIEATRQERLRAQWMEGRPLADIREDIDRALAATADRLDVAALGGLLLVNKELAEREEALDQVDLQDLQLELTVAADRGAKLILGNDLLVSDDVALRWIPRMVSAGDQEIAGRVLGAAEPVDLLSGVATADRSDVKVVADWARCAWMVRSLGAVVAAIGQLRGSVLRRPRFDEEEEGDDPSDVAEANHAVRVDVLVALGTSIQDAKDQASYRDLQAMVRGSDHGDTALLRLDFRTALRFAEGRSVIDDPVAAMERVLVAMPPEDADGADRAYFADVLVRIPSLSHRAAGYLPEGMAPLTLNSFDYRDERPFGQFEPLLRQARASAALGRSLDPASIRETDQSWDLGRILFQRQVVLVGTLWGEALSGRTIGPQEFVRRLRPLLALRRRDWHEVVHWHDWNTVNMAARELSERALEAAWAHGPAVLRAARDAFAEEWRSPRNRDQIGWPDDAKRRIVMACFRLDGDAAAAERLLDEAHGELDANWELNERLEELEARARAWLRLGQRDRAEHALRDMLRLSFGIYHHKDRQIQDWAAWVRRLVQADVNEVVALDAGRLVLRLAALLYDANRGRGASDATEDILHALAGSWPGAAFAAGSWLLDKAVGNRGIVIAALLAAELECGEAQRAAAGLIAASRLLLPYHGWSKRLADALRHLCASPLKQVAPVAAALEIFKRVAASRGLSGKHYMDALEGVEPARPTREAEKETKIVGVERSDGKFLDRDAILVLAARPGELADALSGAKPVGTLDWEEVAVAILACGPGADPRRAALAVLGLVGSSRLAACFCKGAVDWGDRALADASLHVVLKEGRPQGWARFYDGGTRLDAARCLRLVDPEHADARIMRLFVDDYVGHAMAPGEIVLGLEDLIDAMSAQPPVELIWGEVQQHLNALADLQTGHLTPPDLSAGNLPARTAPELLLRDLRALAASLAWDARRGLLDSIVIGAESDAVVAGLVAALEADHWVLNSALAAIACLAWLRPDLCKPFAGKLTHLAISESAVTRLAAQKSLELMGLEVPPAPAKPLPAVYRLHMPEPVQPEVSLRGEVLTPGEPLPNTTDPIDLTRMYHGALRAIGRRSGHEFGLLARRMATLMVTIADPATWSAEAERTYTDSNKAIGLKLDHRRPRALVAQQTFGRVVAELCDAGKLEWPPLFLEHYLLIADPPANLAVPTPRPEWLAISHGKEVGKHPIEDWLEGVGDALPGEDRSPTGDVILAELTNVVSIDGDREEEDRLSVIAHRDLPIEELEPEISGLLHEERYAAQDYPEPIGFDATIPITVIAGGSIFAHSRYVALNPRIGDALGWRLANEGLFRWIDPVGRTMAESIAWAEGNVDVHDAGGLHETAAEGWLVLVTPAGWKELGPHVRSFARHCVARRQTGYSRVGNREVRRAHAMAALTST